MLKGHLTVSANLTIKAFCFFNAIPRRIIIVVMVITRPCSSIVVACVVTESISHSLQQY